MNEKFARRPSVAETAANIWLRSLYLTIVRDGDGEFLGQTAGLRVLDVQAHDLFHPPLSTLPP
jgi:hypothetical protein